MDELVALYTPGDLTGTVTGTAPRSAVRARNLPHAATATVLRDPAGRLYVHRRTTTKDVYPGMHDVFAGGVVAAGEDIDAAAARELAEELGIDAHPTPCLRLWYSDAHANYLACLYQARYDPARMGPIRHQPSEVAWGTWMREDELAAHLADPAWPFVPDGRASWAAYTRWRAARWRAAHERPAR